MLAAIGIRFAGLFKVGFVRCERVLLLCGRVDRRSLRSWCSCVMQCVYSCWVCAKGVMWFVFVQLGVRV